MKNLCKTWLRTASKFLCTKIISWCESPDLLTRYLFTGGQYPELYLQGANYEKCLSVSVWETDKITEGENAAPELLAPPVKMGRKGYKNVNG